MNIKYLAGVVALGVVYRSGIFPTDYIDNFLFDNLIFTAWSALFIGIWHSLVNFPETGNSINKLISRIDELELELSDTQEKLASMELSVDALEQDTDPFD